MINEFRRQSGEVERRIGQGTSQFGSAHPTVLSAQAELERLNEAIRDEAGRIVKSTELDLEKAVGKAKLIEDALRELKERSMRNGGLQSELASVRRRIDVSSSLYETLLRRYMETQAQETFQSADAQVVSYASPSDRPSYPRSNLVLLLAGLCWFGVGAGAGVARELMLPALRTSADVEQSTGVECVATLPIVDPRAEDARGPSGPNLLGPIHWPIRDDLTGRFNQAIFGIRQWVMGRAGDRPQVVLLVGIDAADGSSTIALQLAHHAARAGLQTALVDADLRSSGISEVLRTGTGPTFADAIAKGTPVQDVPNRTYGLSVSLFPSGRNGSPLDILGSRAMGRLIEHLRGRFDLIVIDTAPMSQFIDAEALAEHADSVLVVVKAGKTYHGNVASPIDRLSQQFRLPIGVVLNMAKL